MFTLFVVVYGPLTVLVCAGGVMGLFVGEWLGGLLTKRRSSIARNAGMVAGATVGAAAGLYGWVWWLVYLAAD